MNDLLDAVLDTLIPASEDGRMPGAGSLGLADAVRAQTEPAKDLVAAGLAAADAAGFADLDLEGRVAVLRELESTQPGFVGTLYMTVLPAYYQHPKALEGLGLEPRPPHPKGSHQEVDELLSLQEIRCEPLQNSHRLGR